MENLTHEQLIDIRSLESIIRTFNLKTYRAFINCIDDPQYPESFAQLARMYASHFRAYIHDQ